MNQRKIIKKMEQPTAEEQPGSSKDTQASKERCYEEANHSQHVLSLLEKDSKYCNVTLEAGGEKLKVHESVFGTYSDFFDKAFTGEMNGKYTKEVKLEGISAEVLKSIVNFFYTGKISISLENAIEQLAAANYLMINKIKQFCEKFLTENINASNWYNMWYSAKKCKLPELAKSTAIFIGRNLKTIVDENGLDVFTATELKLILKESKTFRKSEEQTFEVIVAWVKKDRKGRMPLLNGLICNVEFRQFTLKTLKNVAFREEMVRNSTFLMSIVAEELFARNDKLIEEKNQLQLQLNSKNTPNYLLAVDENYAVHMFDFSQKVWKTLSQCTANVQDGSGDCFRYVGNVGDMHVFERKMNNGMKVISSVPGNPLVQDTAFFFNSVINTYAMLAALAGTASSLSRRKQEVQILKKGFDIVDLEGTMCTVEKGTSVNHVYGYNKMTNQWIKLNADHITGFGIRNLKFHPASIVSIVSTNNKLRPRGSIASYDQKVSMDNIKRAGSGTK